MERENIFISIPKDLAKKIRISTEKDGQTISGFFRIAAEEQLKKVK